MPQVDVDLSDYVVEKGMDGIFYYLAREEAAIRNDPVKRTTDLLKSVFETCMMCVQTFSLPGFHSSRSRCSLGWESANPYQPGLSGIQCCNHGQNGSNFKICAKSEQDH